MNPRHFLDLDDLTPEELRALLGRAAVLKSAQRERRAHESLRGRVLGMVFEKSSTRTRVSFEAGMAQLGGTAIFLAPGDTQLGRGEPIEDTARVLSRMVDVVMVRTFGHDRLERFARHSSVPVINGLTDQSHPCQVLADLLTFEERRGAIGGRRVTFIGDGNNMCLTYVTAARHLGFHLTVCSPPGFEPSGAALAAAGEWVRVVDDPHEAVAGSALVVTDVWASMGQEREQQHRREAFARHQVTPELLALADRDVLFMHCLPAHRGEEVSADLLEHPASVVWDEAENRLHVQKALLEFLVAPDLLAPAQAGLGVAGLRRVDAVGKAR